MTEGWATFIVACVALITAFLTLWSARSDRVEVRRAHEDQKKHDEAEIKAQQQQLDSQEEQLERQERQLRETVDREHFRSLWEIRQKGYLEIVSWALSLQESIRLMRDTNDPWQPPILPESGYGMAALCLYADFEVYDSARLLHGEVCQTVSDLELFSSLPPEELSSVIDKYYNDAWRLVMNVRTYALQSPAWREPIPFDGASSGSPEK
jgi:hypothetical protein